VLLQQVLDLVLNMMQLVSEDAENLFFGLLSVK